jgi:hypothetical protein
LPSHAAVSLHFGRELEVPLFAQILANQFFNHSLHTLPFFAGNFLKRVKQLRRQNNRISSHRSSL